MSSASFDFGETVKKKMDIVQKDNLDDEFMVYSCLLDLCGHFDNPSAVDFFKSEAARKQNTQARILIESASDWTDEMKEDELAKVLFAALVLGGDTLSKFRDAFKGQDKQRKT